MSMDSVQAEESVLWQGEGRKRRHVDFVDAQCFGCGTRQNVASENSSFRCSSGHSYTFFRCARCKATFQCGATGNPCPYCLSVQRDGQVTAWEWAADQMRHPERVSLKPQLASAGETIVDVDRRALHDFVLAASGGSRLPADVKCNIDFAKDTITIYLAPGQHKVLAHALSPIKESVRYEDVVVLQITGTTTRRNAGVMGGGFGVVGAAEGMLAAAVINSLTSRTKIYTVLRLATTMAEYVFVSYSVDSSALQLSLTPVQLRIRQAHHASQERQTQVVRDAGSSVADEIRKLATLRDEGILSDEEFAAAKARLLGGA